MEDITFYQNKISMERLQNKGKLLEDCSYLFSQLSRFNATYPRGFYKKACKTIQRDFNKGIKIINKRIPVYVELPALKEYDNGMYQQVNPKTKEPIDDEVHVSADLEVLNDMRALDKYIDSQD